MLQTLKSEEYSKIIQNILKEKTSKLLLEFDNESKNVEEYSESSNESNERLSKESKSNKQNDLNVLPTNITARVAKVK